MQRIGKMPGHHFGLEHDRSIFTSDSKWVQSSRPEWISLVAKKTRRKWRRLRCRLLTRLKAAEVASKVYQARSSPGKLTMRATTIRVCTNGTFWPNHRQEPWIRTGVQSFFNARCLDNVQGAGNLEHFIFGKALDRIDFFAEILCIRPWDYPSGSALSVFFLEVGFWVHQA